MLFQILGTNNMPPMSAICCCCSVRLYKDLPLHPQVKSYARGKLFWQCLNESFGWFAMTQAYDAIYGGLSVEEREQLSKTCFRPTLILFPEYPVL